MGVRKHLDIRIPPDLQSGETLTICSRSFVWCTWSGTQGCVVLCWWDTVMVFIVLRCVVLCCVPPCPPPCPFQVSPGAEEGAQSRVLEEGDWNGREDWVQGTQRVSKLCKMCK